MHRGLALAAGIALLSAGAALASDRDTIVASCETRLKAPARTCECMADKAITEFNARELAFFSAIMAKGVAGAMSAAPSGVTNDEMTHVANRVSLLPAECVGG